MENISSWSPLHHDVSKVIEERLSPEDTAKKVSDVFEAHGAHLSEKDILGIIKKFDANIKSGLCGPSLTSVIVSCLKQI